MRKIIFFTTAILIAALSWPALSRACGVSGSNLDRIYAESSPLTITIDEFESDDLPNQARPIIIDDPEPQSHNFHQVSDQDWVTFTVDRGTYQVKTENLASNSGPNYELYDSGLTLLMSGRGVFDLHLDAGTYFLLLQNYDPMAFGADTEYQLRVGHWNDIYEPDNLSSQAWPITVNSVDAQYHNFHLAFDEDWVTFVSTGTIYTIYTNHLAPNCDTVLDLYNSNLQLITTDFDSGPDGSSLIYIHLSAGTYYVRVHNYDPLVYGVLTEYQLRVENYQFACQDTSMDGFVTDSETGLGVYGAQVKVTLAGVSTSVTTGINGYYIFNALSPGTYTLLVRRSNYTDYSAAGVSLPIYYRLRRNVTLVAKAGTGVLMGTVRDRGTTMGGVHLTISGIPLIANPNGTYFVRLLAGSAHTLVAQATNFNIFTRAGIIITAGQTTTLDVDMVATDSDGDGLTDVEEDALGTNHLSWDTDDDDLPDKFEADHMTSHTQNLDPLNNADGGLDFDGDGNPNAHEFWNGTDPWAAEPNGFPTCGYWAEGNGDGFIGSADLDVLLYAAKGLAEYSSVPPGTGETQDLNADGFFGAADITILIAMAKGLPITDLPARPAAIELDLPPGASPTGAAGDTLRVTVTVRNEAGLPAAGIPVAFSIDPASTGSATILGGEGAATAAGRYDLSAGYANDGRAGIVLRLRTAGTVRLRAELEQCGDGGRGRWYPATALTEPVEIQVQ